MHADALQTLWLLEWHQQGELPVPAEQLLPLSLYISKLVLKQVTEFKWVIKPLSKTYIFLCSFSRDPFFSNA